MASLAVKLGIKPGQRACVLDPPPGAVDLLSASVQPDVTFSDKLADGPYDAIFFWPEGLDGLAGQFATLQQHITANGAVWAVMPKKVFAARRAIVLTWEQMQQAALQTDLVDNKVASLSNEDYATRFVIRKAKRR